MYELSIQEVLKKVNSNENGLSTKDINKNRNKEKNIILKENKRSVLLLFLLQILNPLVYVLIAGFILSLLLKEYSDAFIIIFVILLNAFLSTIQEIKAEKALESLDNLTPKYCLVIRNKIVEQIKVEDLIVGDIVILQEGVNVPADIRLIESNNLYCDESSLTGESMTVLKNHDVILNKSTPLAERVNMAYMSTSVSTGSGKGVVVAIGMNTQIGKIAKMLKDEKKEITPMQKKLNELSKVLAIVSVSLCILIFVIAILQKRDTLEMLITAVSLAVAIIPEGLLAVVTIVLSLGMQKLAKEKSIVKKMHSVETLGCVNVVCSDKTGTLTLNKMNVEMIMVNNKITDKKDDSFEAKLLANIMYYCNDAIINEKGKIGDVMEIALLEYSKQYDINPLNRVDTIPFDSKRKMMSILTNTNQVFTKGSIDNLLVNCPKMLVNGRIINIDINKIYELQNKLAGQGLRVLAFAYKDSSILDESNLIFVGLAAMQDPPRKEAIQSIKTLKKASIRTIMITGDNKKTAYAIGRQLNIVKSENEVITGSEIDDLTIEELSENIDKYSIYARVTPENKINIVKAFQRKGNIVAMSGDGVNDAPALKKANIGIAMGINGSDVSKNAADMILLDDNFSTIEKAIKQGRGIYNNIKKSILFLLSSNIGEVLIMLIAIILKFPMPLLAIHILWVNLLTDTFPSLALGQDKIEDDMMNEKPRSYHEAFLNKSSVKLIITYGIFIGLLSFASFVFVPIMHLLNNNMIISYSTINQLLSNNEAILFEARSYAFTTLALSQLFHSLGMKNVNKSIFSKQTFNNYLLIISLLFGIFIQVLVTSVPFLIEIFKTSFLNFIDWIYILAFSISPLLIHELIIIFKKSKK